MSEKMHHIQCEKDEVGEYVFLPGDPKRVEVIASFLENSKLVADSREFVTYTGYLDGVKVSVTSTGIGGPSAAIAMEELIKIGAKTFIRIGTCGGINPQLLVGSSIIATAAIRKEGTSKQYLPIEFPAVANYDVVFALKEAAQKNKQQHYIGVVESKDSYYGQHDPNSMPVKNELSDKWEAYKLGGALASEMEAAALFTVAAVRGVRCGGIMHLVRNKEKEILTKSEVLLDNNVDITIKIAIDAMKNLILQDAYL